MLREPALVAIIEDDDVVRRALARLVSSLHYETATFAAAEAFMVSLPHCQPRCAVVDLHLPGIRGIELVEQSRRLGYRVPMIIITGFDRAGMREKCLQMGAVAYLPKPLDAAVLAAAIEEAVQA